MDGFDEAASAQDDGHGEAAQAQRGPVGDDAARQGNEQLIGFALQLAGIRNVKAARALLPDHDNNIEKLKVMEPWLFGEGASAPAQTGAMGLPNASAATDEGATTKRWREITGLDE